MNKNLLVGYAAVIAVVAFVGCADDGASETQSGAESTATKKEALHDRAPLTLKLDRVSSDKDKDEDNNKTTGEIALQLTVGGRSFQGPVTLSQSKAIVTFDLPKGVTLLDPDDATRPVGVKETRIIRFDVADGANASDIHVRAQIKGAGFGATARATYRFGRSAPLFLPAKLPRTFGVAH